LKLFSNGDNVQKILNCNMINPTIEVDMRSIYASSDGQLYIQLHDGSDNLVFEFQMRNQNKKWRLYGSDYSSWTENIWYTIMLKNFNWTSHTCDLYVNGGFIATANINPSAINVRKVKLGCNNSGDGYFDNFLIIN